MINTVLVVLRSGLDCVDMCLLVCWFYDDLGWVAGMWLRFEFVFGACSVVAFSGFVSVGFDAVLSCGLWCVLAGFVVWFALLWVVWFALQCVVVWFASLVVRLLCECVY